MTNKQLLEIIIKEIKRYVKEVEFKPTFIGDTLLNGGDEDDIGFTLANEIHCANVEFVAELSEDLGADIFEHPTMIECIENHLYFMKSAGVEATADEYKTKDMRNGILIEWFGENIHDKQYKNLLATTGKIMGGR